MSDFNKTFKAIQKLKNEIKNTTNSFGEAYYKSINILNDLQELAFRNSKFNSIFLKYIENQSTLTLKELLVYIKYDDKELCDFNAFCIIDSASYKLK